MKFCIDYLTLKTVCKQYKVMTALSDILTDSISPEDTLYRGLLNILFLDDSKLEYKPETSREIFYMKEYPEDARLFLPTGKTHLNTVPIEFLCEDEYLSKNDYTMLKEKQQDIKRLLSLRKVLLEAGVSIEFPKGFEYVGTGDRLEPFYMKGYDILPITQSKLVVVNNPLEKFQGSISFLKGASNSFDICELEALFKKCKEEGLVLNVTSDGVRPGDECNPFYYKPISHLYTQEE